MSRLGETHHARDVNLQTAPDEEIFSFARDRQSILITRDLEFGNPHLYRVTNQMGLIIIRVPSFFTARDINRLLEWFLTDVVLDELAGAVTVIEPGRFRVRKIE